MAKKSNGITSIVTTAVILGLLGLLAYTYFTRPRIVSTPPTIIYEEREPVYVSSVYPSLPYYWGYGPRWGGWGGGYYGGGWHKGGKIPGGGFGGGGKYHGGLPGMPGGGMPPPPPPSAPPAAPAAAPAPSPAPTPPAA